MKKERFIIVLMITGFMTFNSLADDLNCAADENSTCEWHYDENTHTLTITGTGKMKDYGADSLNGNYDIREERPWHNIMGDVQNVVISGLSNIGGLAFIGANSLSSVTIPEGVSSIGYGSFAGTTNLTSITIPDTVTSIATSAFYGDNKLESISLSENSSLQTIGRYAFSGLTALTDLSLPDGLQSIETGAFEDVNHLTSLVVPEGTVVSEYAFPRMTAVTIYCTDVDMCSGFYKSHVEPYLKDKSGLFALTDENGDILEDTNGNPIYYLSANDMTAQSNACLGGYQTCAEQALHNKALALLEKGTVCQTLDTCQALVNTDYNGDVIKLGGKDYASLTDLLKGNSMPKRIYTIEEANAVAKPTGNTVRIKYR